MRRFRRAKAIVILTPAQAATVANSANFAYRPSQGYTKSMSTIKAILQPDPDGTLHLLLPPELRHGPLQVTAFVEPAPPAVDADGEDRLKGFGCLRGKISLSSDFDEPLEDFQEYME